MRLVVVRDHKIVITLEIMVTIPEIQEITARIPVMEITVVISKKICREKL